MVRRLTVIAALGVFLVTFGPTTASAASIFQVHAFGGSTFDALGVTPFDPSLGTLDRIDVQISGTLQVSGVTATNFIDTGFGLVPVAYQFGATVDQRFDGLAGGYFDYSSPARFRFDGVASGTGETFTFATNFDFSFAFTSVTDLIGFAFPSFSTTSGLLTPPISGMTGQRSDFLAGNAVNEIDMFQAAIGVGLLPPTIVAFQSGGSLEMTYTYTPITTAVPEPATLWLLAGGLAALGARAVRPGRRRPILRRDLDAQGVKQRD